jgi:hypothetical protein
MRSRSVLNNARVLCPSRPSIPSLCGAQAAAAGRDALRLEFTMPDGCNQHPPTFNPLPFPFPFPFPPPLVAQRGITRPPRYPYGVPVRFVVRESHLLKAQAAALGDTVSAAAAAAAAANEVACYNLVQCAQSWLEQMSSSSSSLPQPGTAVKAHAALCPVPSLDAPAAAAPLGHSGDSSVAILLDLWKQGQDIHAQYMVCLPFTLFLI